MGVIFNISQNKKKLKDLFVNRPTRPPVQPVTTRRSAPRRKVSTGPRRESVRNRATFNPLQFQQKNL